MAKAKVIKTVDPVDSLWLENALKIRYETKSLNCYEPNWKNKYILMAEYFDKIFCIDSCKNWATGKHEFYSISVNDLQKVCMFESIEGIDLLWGSIVNDIYSEELPVELINVMSDINFNPVRYHIAVKVIQEKYSFQDFYQLSRI